MVVNKIESSFYIDDNKKSQLLQELAFLLSPFSQLYPKLDNGLDEHCESSNISVSDSFNLIGNTGNKKAPSFQMGLFYFTACLEAYFAARLRAAPRATKPKPNNTKPAGSGTVTLVNTNW